MNQLTITTKPYKSSLLTITPSPFSPKFPITPRSPSLIYQPRVRPDLEFPPPPAEPLHWLWQCHLCNRVYRLGATRRCLDDGHYFCAGTTTVKRNKRNGNKKTIRHKACQSEFDYQGWKDCGNWRRNVQEQIEAAETLEQFLRFDESEAEMQWSSCGQNSKRFNGQVKNANDYQSSKNCWLQCDYPSQCRWGAQYGVQTPTLVAATETTPKVTVTIPSSPAATGSDDAAQEDTSFDDILLDISDIADESLSEGDVEDQETPPTAPTSPVEEKKPSMDDLLESAKRRKRRSTGAVPSPLASNPPSPIELGSATASPTTPQALPKAFDDFDLDLRTRLGRASEAFSSLFSGGRVSSKADGLTRWSRKRSIAGTW